MESFGSAHGNYNYKLRIRNEEFRGKPIINAKCQAQSAQRRGAEMRRRRICKGVRSLSLFFARKKEGGPFSNKLIIFRVFFTGDITAYATKLGRNGGWYSFILLFVFVPPTTPTN